MIIRINDAKKEDLTDKDRILIIPDKKFNVPLIEGCAEFLSFYFECYTIENEKLKAIMQDIIDLIYSLRSDVSRYTHSNADQMDKYKQKIRESFENPVMFNAGIKPITIKTEEEYDITIPEYKVVQFAFRLEKEGYQADFIEDLRNQINHLRVNKDYNEKYYEIDRLLVGNGTIEYVVTSVNILLEAFCYSMNCSSSRSNVLEVFDKIEIERRIEFAKIMIR